MAIRKTTKLIYFTHPSVHIDAETPISEWHLSEKGWEQAHQAINMDIWKEVDVMYASTELKAYSMAEKIAQKHGIPFDKSHKIEDLGETRNRTFIPPKKFEDAVTEWYRDLGNNVNGWEPINSMSKRIANTTDKLMSMHPGKTVAIVGHGGAGTLTKCHIKGIEPRREEDPHNLAGGYFIADWDNKKILKDWQKFWM